MKKKSFYVMMTQGHFKKIASGIALSVAIIASVASSPSPPPCGDGSTSDGGAGLNNCDDGNLNNGDGCSKTCQVERGFECSDPGQITGPSECAPAFCGNGLRFTGVDFGFNVNEECDDGELNSDTTPNGCRTDCSLPACGDGILDDLFGEFCDEGANNSDTAPDGCRTGCILPSCGDTVVDAGEECDDGNNNPDDGCSPGCVADFCGDGINNNNNTEACDDGNTNDGDGCSSLCVIEFCGDSTTNNNPDPNNPNEQCDEGANNSDTTPNTCRVGCILPSCGDSVLDNGEVCDSGVLNSQFPNACRLDCATPSCGDGIVDDLFAEQCDDGNLDDTDGCKSDCTL
jgi:cysteine-rich repeat protein